MDSSFWSKISTEAKDLIASMLKVRPQERISSGDAVKHAWFKKFNDLDRDFVATIKGALKNLVNFRAIEQEMVAIYSFFASELLSKSELNVVTAVFKALDVEGDGLLGIKELKESLEKYPSDETKNVNEHQIKDLFRMINLANSKGLGHGNEEISYSQFCMAAMNQTVLINKDKVHRAFKLFDYVRLTNSNLCV